MELRKYDPMQERGEDNFHVNHKGKSMGKILPQFTDSQTCAKAEGKDPKKFSRKRNGHNAFEHSDRTFTIFSELPGRLDIGIEHRENKHVVMGRTGKLIEKSESL